MTKITNNTRQTLDFVVAGKAKDGVPPTKSIEPGETADLDVDVNRSQFRGRVLSGAITVSQAVADKAAAAATGDKAR